VLVGLNSLQHWLWQRLHAGITETLADRIKAQSA
jgi:hypothetical protein